MHHAEAIMQAILALITGLTITGANVARGRAYPVDAVPALTLMQGEDALADGLQNMSFVDRILNVRIACYVKTGAQFDTDLNQIRREVYVALMANRNLGLPNIVIDTTPAGDDEPELSGDGEKNIGQQIMNFAITYRHSLTDPGA